MSVASGAQRDIDEGVAVVLRDVDDLAVLYKSEHVHLVRLARALTTSSAAAEEIVHEAFIKVFERRSSIDSPAGYLRRVVVNECHSRTRRAAVERSKLDILRRRVAPPVAAEPGARQELLSTLRELPQSQRTAIVLRFYEDLSVSATADLMNVPEGTVKSLVHRGLRTLRSSVEEGPSE